MIELEPWLPYPEDVRFPVLNDAGVIETTDQRPSIFSPYTAGFAVDETPLDQSLPFERFEGGQPDGKRMLGFPVFRWGEVYRTYDAASYCVDLAAQMIGAVNLEEGIDNDAVYYFELHEETLDTVGDQAHHDSRTNNPIDRAAIVCNIMPTYYMLQGLNRYDDSDPIGSIGLDVIPDDILWCARPNEITVHQGKTPHSVAIYPPAANLIRRVAQLRVYTPEMALVEKANVQIDDVYFRPEAALELLK